MRPTIILNGEPASTASAADDATLRAFVSAALTSAYGLKVRVDDFEVRRENGERIELVCLDGSPCVMSDFGMKDGETLYVTHRIGVGA
jgi:hypothetical protein